MEGPSLPEYLIIELNPRQVETLKYGLKCSAMFATYIGYDGVAPRSDIDALIVILSFTRRILIEVPLLPPPSVAAVA